MRVNLSRLRTAKNIFRFTNSAGGRRSVCSTVDLLDGLSRTLSPNVGAIHTMQIYGPYRVSTAATGPTPPAGGINRTAAAKPKPSAAPVDQLDLSSSTTGVNRLDSLGPSEAIAGGGEIRIDKVADLRRQIADGSYDTPEKMDAALDRFLDVLG